MSKSTAWWSYAVVIAVASAVSLMGLLHISPFGLPGFVYFIVIAVLGLLLVDAITRRLILPVWLKWPRKLQLGLFAGSVLATAIIFLLLSFETPMGSTWRWGIGPQVGQAVVPAERISWGQVVPGVLEFNVSSWPGLPDPDWAWRMTTDLSGLLGNTRVRMDFRVTQPDDEVFNLNSGAQWEPYRASDGVTLAFKALRGETWQAIHHVALNLHTSPAQRRWHVVEVDLPVSSRSLAIEVESGANHLGDKVLLSVDRIRVRVLGLWLNVGRLLSLGTLLSTFWLVLMGSILAVAGLESLQRFDDEHVSGLLGAGLLGQSVAIWLLATIPVGAAAGIGTSQVLRLAGWQRAAWLSIKVNAKDRSQPPPFMYVNHTGETGAFEPVTWRAWKAGYTPVGIRPSSNTGGLKILAIRDEQDRVIPPATWRLPSSGMTLQDDKQTVLVAHPGVLWLPNRPYPGALVIVFVGGPGAGTVELDALDQRRTFDLSSPTPISYRAELGRPAAYEGWFLLPAREINQISIKFGNRESAYGLHELTIYDDFKQTWAGSALTAGATSAANCHLIPEVDDLRVERDRGSDCTLVVPNLRPLNVVTWSMRLLVWAVLTLAGLATLGLLAVMASLSRRWEERYQFVESQPAVWMRQRTAPWTVGKVALAIGIVTVAFQLIYFLVVPIGYINDTHGYYSLARDYMRLKSLYAIDPTRTPGYPIFLASTIWFFGDQMEAVVLLQHLVLALLGPLTAWFLYPRTGPLLAALGGLLIGIGATTSLLANTVATESLFASLCYVALLCTIHYQSRPAGVFLAGLLAGLATLIRPNGILLPVVMFAWLFLGWWCGPRRLASLRGLVFSGVALALGCLLAIGPWLRAERGMTGQWELDNRSPFTLWRNSMIEGRAPATLAINRPAATILRFSDLATQCDDIEGWRLHVELALAGHIDWPTVSATDSQFFTESVWEGIRQNPRRFLQFFYQTFSYSLLHIMPAPDSPLCIVDNAHSEIYFGRFTYPLPVPSAVSDAKNIEPFLRQLSYRWHPAKSPLRSAMFRVTQLGVDTWPIAGAFALASLVACLILKPFRDLTLLWLYWLVSVTLLGVMGWPTDRYMFVLEPLVYSLATVMVYVLLSARVRRVGKPANS